MSSTISIFLKQHIGQVEQWISEQCIHESYHTLVGLGVELRDGVYGYWCDVELSPSGVSCNLEHMSKVLDNYDQLTQIITAYLAYLHDLDSTMIQQASELDKRRTEYDYACVREELIPGGNLWLRTRQGVKHIVIQSLDNTGKVTFSEKDSPELQVAHITSLQLFSNKEDALNPMKEGYNAKFN